MDFAANFTAIDFETASRRPDSACQLAAVQVRQGRIVDQASWLIRPEPLYFSRTNIEIHGITPHDVRDSPTFGECWPEISQRFGDDCLVAHNAIFDIGVLLNCLRAHGHPIPEFQFTCTRTIARRTWPHRRRYGLKPLAQWLGIRFRHHDALEDSIACAKILLAAGIDRDADSLPDLERRLRLGRGAAGDWGYRTPAARSKRKQKSTAPPAINARGRLSAAVVAESAESFEPALDLQRVMVRAGFIRPLSGKRVVVCGKFRLLTRAQVQALAVQLGGECADHVDESTDVLILGQPLTGSSPPDAGSPQIDWTGELGHAIEVIDERKLLDLVGSEKK